MIVFGVFVVFVGVVVVVGEDYVVEGVGIVM